jgi:DedD protein
VARNQFKQRIVGGLVLVALGAIVIPFLLDMHQGGEWWGTGNIPKKPDNGFVTRVLPLDKWSKQAQTDLAKGEKQLSTVPAQEDTPASPAAQQSQSSSRPAAAPPPAEPVTATSTPSPAGVSASATGDQEGWVVQLGSFSNQKNADELVARLREKSYRVFVERIAQGNRTVYRVRVGPQRQRAAAEAVRDRLASELRLKAMVMHLP